jgi:hypothetical protein
MNAIYREAGWSVQGELRNLHIHISRTIYRYSFITQQRKSDQKRRRVPTEHPNNNNNVTYRAESIRIIIIIIIIIIISSGCADQRELRPHRHTRFRDHTHRRATVSRTPLGRVTLQHITQTSMPWRDLNPRTKQASSRRPTP